MAQKLLYLQYEVVKYQLYFMGFSDMVCNQSSCRMAELQYTVPSYYLDE